jgi:hypothetical protein
VLEGSVRVESRVGRWAPRSYKEGEQCVARGEAEPEKRPLDVETRKQLLRWVVDLERPVPGASGTAWEITRSERAVSTGRIVVHVPATADVKVVVFKDGAEVGYWFGNGSKSLFPGNYDVTVSGAPVASVPVQKGMDTRIRAGVFKIKVDGGWELYDESGTRELYYAFDDKSVGLPVGTYKLKIAGIFGPVTIRDNETTEF